MRGVFVFLLVCAFVGLSCKRAEQTQTAAMGSPVSARTVEAGCATCIFNMKGVTGCKLAVKIDGKSYLVEGSRIDDHGDAHASDGLCNASRQAQVTGHVKGDRFVAKKVELLP